MDFYTSVIFYISLIFIILGIGIYWKFYSSNFREGLTAGVDPYILAITDDNMVINLIGDGGITDSYPDGITSVVEAYQLNDGTFVGVQALSFESDSAICKKNNFDDMWEIVKNTENSKNISQLNSNSYKKFFLEGSFLAVGYENKLLSYAKLDGTEGQPLLLSNSMTSVVQLKNGKIVGINENILYVLNQNGTGEFSWDVANQSNQFNILNITQSNTPDILIALFSDNNIYSLNLADEAAEWVTRTNNIKITDKYPDAQISQIIQSKYIMALTYEGKIYKYDESNFFEIPDVTNVTFISHLITVPKNSGSSINNIPADLPVIPTKGRIAESINISNDKLLYYYPFNGDVKNYVSQTGVEDVEQKSIEIRDNYVFFSGENTPSLKLPKFRFTNDGITIAGSAYFIDRPKGRCRLFDFGSGEESNNLAIGFSDESKIFIVMRNMSVGGPALNIDINYKIVSRRWYHFCLTIGTSNILNLYVNGTLIKILDNINIYPSLQELTSNYIGKSNWTDHGYPRSYIKNFTVLNREFNKTEVAVFYKSIKNVPNPPIPPPPVKQSAKNPIVKSVVLWSPNDVVQVSQIVIYDINDAIISNISIMAQDVWADLDEKAVDKTIDGNATVRNYPDIYHSADTNNNPDNLKMEVGLDLVEITKGSIFIAFDEERPINTIRKIVYYNRGDCCQERSKNMVLFIGDVDNIAVRVFNRFTGAAVQTVMITLPYTPISENIDIDNKSLIIYYPFDKNDYNYASGSAENDAYSTRVSYKDNYIYYSGQPSIWSGSAYTRISKSIRFSNTGLTIACSAFYLSTPTSWARLFDFGNGAGIHNIGIGFVSGKLNIFMYNVSVGQTSETVYYDVKHRTHKHKYSYTRTNDTISLPTTYTVPTGQWCHFCLTITSSNYLELRVNNNIVFTRGGVYPSTSTLRSNYISRSNWSGDGYPNCYMKHFIVMNRALNSSEITTLYDSVK